ncbi:hypothetical protein PISMIDRAFT_17124 [Pisolithus microcarpus 441]|uniref:Unplaced genomic scaffold scaffold_243, whole genome shotgun sequence n=1 Tax=Pisolithus microcarpus 441 TaxID=765257 RepID=A0A0C9YDA8_9AGAM|nr:hypothetical protein PISMIDRAFT_17124 [Pisolithus microcarpus 441]
MLSSATHLQTIVPWEMALMDELEDKLGDSVAVKMAKFDERQCCQRLAHQRELEAEEQRMAKEAERVHKEQEAKAKRIRELEAERKWLEEETRWAQQAGGSSSQQVPASSGKAVERPNRCSMCIKAGEECKPGTGCSKSCVRCQKLKAKCDLITQMTDTEKRPVDMTSPQGGEKQKCHRKSKALMEVIIDIDDRDNEAMEDTPDVEMDSMAKVLNRRKNNTTIATLAGDVQDLSGVLEESFEALKTTTMALVSQAQNADDV